MTLIIFAPHIFHSRGISLPDAPIKFIAHTSAVLPNLDMYAQEEEGLSDEQRRALRLVMHGHNVCITGSGGAGKSFLIQRLTQALTSESRIVMITASTGVAASQIDGRTLHSFLGMGIMEKSLEDTVSDARLVVKKKPWLRSFYGKYSALIIDEISMIDPDMFAKADRILRVYRRMESRPFGGLQIILVGDFYQIPPVRKNAPSSTASASATTTDPSALLAAYLSGTPPAKADDADDADDASPRYIFETDLFQNVLGGPTKWRQHVVELQTVFRQTDASFVALLNRAREGSLTDEDIRLLRTRVGVRLVEAESRGIKPTILVSLRRQADTINRSELLRLQQKLQSAAGATAEDATVEYVAQFSVFQDPGFPGRQAREALERALERVRKNRVAPERTTLCVGAQVMITTNIDVTRRLVNGTRGVVVDFWTAPGAEVPCVVEAPGVVPGQKYPVVRTATEDVTILPVKRETKVPYAGSVFDMSVPLMLAWALTTHKSQGQTLDFVQLTLDSSVFESGMAYVALSRARALEGITLKTFDPSVVTCDERVTKFYRELREYHHRPADATTVTL